MCMPWKKLWNRYLDDGRFTDVAVRTGASRGVCQLVWLRGLSDAGRDGRFPETSIIRASEALEIEQEVVERIVAEFRAVGLLDRSGRLSGWEADQLSDKEREDLTDRRRAEAERKRLYRARKAGKPVPVPESKPEPAPKPAPAPAPEPTPTPKPQQAPKPKRESKPKQDVKAPQPGHSAALLPGLVASPAPAPKRPSMSEAEKRQLFDEFWAAGGDPSQSPNGAWSYWKKLVWTKEKAAELTAAIGRAQALQDARGLSRYNVPKWFREHGYEAEACTSEEAFQAALSKAHAPRRGGKPIPGGVSDAFHMVDRLASRMGWGAPAENISDGGTAVPPQRGEYYDCEFTVVSSAAC